jgi:hypothetical protein
MFGLTNPWILLGAVVAAVAIAGGGYTAGHKQGTTAQAQADQKQFDRINQGITAQKAEAAKLYREAQDKALAAVQENDRIKTQLETEHANNAKAITDIRHKYDSLQLRFRAKDAGAGPNGSSPLPSGGNPAGAESAPIVQLPDEVTRGLRQLAQDADQLANDYRKCYGFLYPKP